MERWRCFFGATPSCVRGVVVVDKIGVERAQDFDFCINGLLYHQLAAFRERI